MKNLKRVLPILLIFVLLFAGGCKDKSDDTGNESDVVEFCGKQFPALVSADTEVARAFLYNGEYPEDGSFRDVTEVFAIKVTNVSQKDIQLVRFYVVTDQNEYLFEVTTLPSQKSVTVLEKNGQTILEDEKILEIKEENKIFFENGISLNADKFQLTPLDKVINIKNISSENISSDVYVYFKRVDENGDYFGGITFRSNAGALKADEFKQIPASHFMQENSEVLFVDYAKP